MSASQQPNNPIMPSVHPDTHLALARCTPVWHADIVCVRRAHFLLK
jgi:hypothetical protein